MIMDPIPHPSSIISLIIYYCRSISFKSLLCSSVACFRICTCFRYATCSYITCRHFLLSCHETLVPCSHVNVNVEPTNEWENSAPLETLTAPRLPYGVNNLQRRVKTSRPQTTPSTIQGTSAQRSVISIIVRPWLIGNLGKSH